MKYLKCSKCGAELEIAEWEQYGKYMIYDCDCSNGDCSNSENRVSVIFELVPVKEYHNNKMGRYETIFDYMKSIGEM